MIPKARHILTKYRVPILFAALAASSACTVIPTKPNPMLGGPYPSPLSALLQKNPTVARELLRIPELQDGISPAEVTAIEAIYALYERDETAFDRAFREMMSTGLPNVRRYCTPLQALFWLALEGKITEGTNPLVDYSLRHLLDKAWTFSRERDITVAEILQIIEGMKNEEKRKEHQQNVKNFNLARVKGMLVLEYRNRPQIFSREAAEIIKAAMHPSVDPRWKSFQEVTERLNAPELIDYYERRRFQYEYWWNIRFYSAQNPDPRYAFMHNRGDCVYITSFTVYCLKTAGFKAWEKRMPSRSVQFSYHAVTAFEWNNRVFIMDNSDDKRGIVTLEEY